MDIIVILFWVVGFILFFFAFYQFFFLIISAIYWIANGKQIKGHVSKQARFGIIIPAHNEELLIGGLVKSINECNYPHDLVHTYVIADNCSPKDKTAEIARSFGADVQERFDQDKRGKPYALNWLISSIDLDSYDAFVIIDADTVIDKQFLIEMNNSIQRGNKVIQGYFGVMNPDENWLTRLSILPGVLKFLLHFPGKRLMGLSCPLAGNGMCFSAEVFKKYGWNAYSVAENWEYYVQLTLNDYMVTSAEDAIIYSQVAKNLKTGKDQRQRWQRGRIETLRSYWKQLITKSITKFRFVYLDALLEVARPSHSMLLFSSISFVILSAVAGYFAKVFNNLFIFGLVIVGLQVIYFLAGLIVQKAPLKTWLSLFMVPPYLIWKFFISITAIMNRKNNAWIKTERH